MDASCHTFGGSEVLRLLEVSAAVGTTDVVLRHLDRRPNCAPADATTARGSADEVENSCFSTGSTPPIGPEHFEKTDKLTVSQPRPLCRRWGRWNFDTHYTYVSGEHRRARKCRVTQTRRRANPMLRSARARSWSQTGRTASTSPPSRAGQLHSRYLTWSCSLRK